MKNIVSSGEIFFELASGVEPLRMTSTKSTFAGDVLAEGGNITVKDTGTENAMFRAYATGTGYAGIIMDASNGDGAGSDYFTLRQLDNLQVEFNTRANAGNTLFYSKGVLNLTQNGANSTFAGDVLVEDNLYLTDSGTVRGKIQLNSSDRDDLDIKAVSLGSNMKFFTVDTERMRITSAGAIIINATAVRESASKLSVQGGMSEFETTLTNNDDWQNSPISILERGNVQGTQTADKYAPNLNFHWGGLVSNSLWMGSNGNLNYGSYSGAGTPAVNGTFATGNLVAASAITGSTGAFTGQVTGPTPSTSTSFANKAYVDAHVSPAGTYLPLAGGTMNSGATIGMTGSLTIDGGGSSTDVLKLKGSARIQIENASGNDSFYISNTGGSGASTLDLGGALSLVENGNATFTGTIETTKVRSDIMNNKADSANIIYRSGTNTIVGNHANALVIEDSGSIGIGTATPDTDGYSFAEDLVIKGGASASDGAGITIAGNGKRYGVIAFGDAADVNAGEIFYDHTANSMHFRTNGSSTLLNINSSGDVQALGKLTVNGSAGINVDSATHASVNLDRASTSYDNNLIYRTNGAIKWRLWQDGSDDFLYIRDEANASNIVSFKTGGATTFAGDVTIADGLDFRLGAVMLQDSGAGRLGFNRDTSDGSIHDSGYNAFQIQVAASGSSGKLEIQEYNGSGTYAGSTLITGSGITINDYVTHNGDPNTYFGFGGADAFRVVAGGSEKLHINTSGLQLGGTNARVSTIYDQDNMSSNSATALATQQSIKAYVDNSISGGANYLGVWDPDDSLNNGYGNPSLQASTRTDDSGDYFICSANGAAHPNGGTTEPDSWHTGDWVVWNEDLGSSGLWQKIDNTTVLSGGGTTNKLAIFTDSETIGDSRFSQSGTANIITGPGNAASDKSLSVTSAGNTEQLYIQGTGEVVVSQNYLYVSASQGAYINGILRARSGVTDDSSTLGLGGAGEVDNLVLTSNTSAAFKGKLAVNGTSVFADAELDVLGDITLINRNWALRGNNSNTDLAIERVAGSSFNDNNIAVTVSGQKFVGIGTTSPNSKLDVRQAGDGIALELHNTGGNVDDFVDIKMIAGNISAGTLGTILRHQRDGSGGGDFSILTNPTLTGTPTTKLIVKSGGNVGIGTDSPNQDGFGASTKVLSLKANTSGGESVLELIGLGNSDNDQVGVLNFMSQAATTPLAAIKGLRYTSDTNGKLAFYTSNAERMRINESGNVGIGTNGPAKRLHVSASDQSTARIRISNTNTGSGGDNIDLVAGINNVGQDGFSIFNATSNQTQLVIQGGGNVGIGVTNPGQKLEVAGYLKANGLFYNGTSGGELRIDNSSGGGIGYYADNTGHTFNTWVGAWQPRMSITDAGNVGIGTTSPAFKLDVDGTFGVSDLPGNATSTSVLVRNETIGSELVSNGDFTGNPDLWSGSESITNGQLTKTGNGLAYQSISLTGGATYFITVDVASISGTPLVYAAGLQSGGLSVGLNELYLVAGSSNTLFGINNGSGSVFNSISLKLVTSASDQIQTRQLSSDIFTSGPFLPLAGGTMTGTTRHGDDVVSYWGAGDDLEIYHNSSGDSVIQNHVGDLYLTQKADDKDIIFRSDDGLGAITEYFRVDGGESNTIFSRDLKFLDSGLPSRKLIFGTGNDLQIKHNGTDSYIENYTGDLQIVNYADDKDIKFWSDNGSGGIEQYIQIDGSEGRTLFNKNIRLNDSVQAQFGGSADLQIYHDSSASYIENKTGHVYFMQRANDKDIYFQSDNGSGGDATYFFLDGSATQTTFQLDTKHNDNVKAKFGDSVDLEIFHNGSTSSIYNNTGNLVITNGANDSDIIFKSDDSSGGTTEYFRVDGGITKTVFVRDTKHLDNKKALFGDQDDLQIYHDGSNSYIDETGTGSLYIKSAGAIRLQSDTGENMIYAVNDAAVNLYYNNSKKFETSNAGVSITGSLSTTQDISVSGDVMVTGTTTAGGTLICEGNITVQDSDKLQLGNSQDLELYHASGVSYIDNDTGHLYIRNNVDNDDGSNIYIQAKSGEHSILCQDDGAVSLYNNNVQKFSTNSTGAGAYGYIGFGSAGTSTGSTYGFRYGSSSPNGSQGIVITVSDTGGSYFDGVGRFQNTNTGQGAGMFQMVNYGSLYGRYMQFFRGSTSNIIGYIGYNSSNTSVTFSTTNSDIRTKKNITTWDENVLDKFKALQPKRFDFKVAIGDKGAVKERGFIAQYEKDNFPEAYQLNGNDEKATYGFHPMEMVPYMMKAIKDLTIKNEELERRIKTLES